MQSIIDNKISEKSPEFATNNQNYQKLINELNHLETMHLAGGNSKKRAKHLAQNKLLARDRIKALLDDESTWLEIGKYAGHDLYQEPTPSANIVCGIGLVSGCWVMMISNDPTTKAGCYFPITIKKHLRAQEIALKLKLPCIYLVDSAGIYLPMQAQSFADNNDFGKIFYNQAQLSNKKIPQIAIVFGSCVAGGAYIPAMSDETIMVENQSSIFLAGPALVAAATKEQTDQQSLGGSELHSKISGVADYTAQNDIAALKLCKDIIKTIPNTRKTPKKLAFTSNNQATKIYGLIPKDQRMPLDIRQIIANIVDQDSLQEFKVNYASGIITAYAKVGGFSLAIIANNGVLLSESAKKAKQFIDLANQRQTPLLFLQNITGFMVGKQAESSGIIKYGADLVKAVSSAEVAKITIMLNSSYGAGNYAMCGRAFKPDFLWSWPNATTAVMGCTQISSVLQKINANIQPDKLEQEIKQQSSALYGSARLWDDGIIDPGKTRDILIHSLSILNNI